MKTVLSSLTFLQKMPFVNQQFSHAREKMADPSTPAPVRSEAPAQAVEQKGKELQVLSTKEAEALVTSDDPEHVRDLSDQDHTETISLRT